MADVVLDSSAALAFLLNETGAEVVRAARWGSAMSAVNYAEVIAKLIEDGVGEDEAQHITDRLGCRIFEADRERAALAARLYAKTRRTGVSQGDRFCLALAREMGRPVLTADRLWATLDLDIEITLIR